MSHICPNALQACRSSIRGAFFPESAEVASVALVKQTGHGLRFGTCYTMLRVPYYNDAPKSYSVC